jgi:flagellar biosynthesis GTPase FlhF
MSEAPTHSAGVPTPARPQQTERTPQTDRMPQLRPDAQRTDAQRAEAQRTDAQSTEAQRTDAQRTDAQHTDAERTDAQRNEAVRTERQRNEPQRNEHERAEQHRAEQPTGSQRTDQKLSSKLEDEWQAVQYEFVDDPKSAVRKADDLVTRALEELNTRHRSLTKQLEGNGDPQTEDLRLALHRYRELFKSLVAVK